jgi:hypothetical protein
MSSISSVTSALGGSTSSSNTASWLESATSGNSSASWLDGTSSQSGATAQAVWGSNSSLSNSLASALTGQVSGENNLAGEAALTRIEAAVTTKESQQSSAGATSPSGSGGYGVVQNLMASLDDITINNGSAPPATIGSSSAANGYSATQNLLTSLDNITINNGPSGVLPGAYAPNALMGVDSVIATPKVNIKA